MRICNKKTKCRLISFTLPIVSLIILGAINDIGVFGNKTVLMWDAQSQYINFLSYLQDILRGNTNELFYSLSISPGEGNALLNAYYLMSPINLIAILFSKRTLPYAFMIIQGVKIGLSGAFMHMFLEGEDYADESGELAPFIRILLSVSYALNGFVAVYMSNIIWLDGVFVLPLMAKGIKTLTRHGNAMQYYCALLYAIFTNFYMGYMLAVFGFIFFIYTLLQNNSRKDYFNCIKKYVVYSVLAVTSSSLVLLPAIYELTKSKLSGTAQAKNDRDPAFILYELCVILMFVAILVCIYHGNRLLEKKIVNHRVLIVVKLFATMACLGIGWKLLQHIAGKGWIDKKLFTWPLQLLIGAADRNEIFVYGLAHLYVGVFALAVMILFVADKRMAPYAKFLDSMFLGVLILMLCCYDIDVVMHGGSYPVGSPHRWSFIISFFILQIVADYLRTIGNSRLHVKDISITGIILLLALFLVAIKCYKEYGMQYLHIEYVAISFVLLVMYLIFICFFSDRKLFEIIATVVLCVELCINVYGVLRDYSFMTYAEYNTYIDEMKEIMNAIDENQKLQGKDDETFRVESDYYESFYYIAGYNSLYHYSSGEVARNKAFMTNLGFETDFAYVVPNNMDADPNYVSLLGVKYLVSKSPLDVSNYKLLYKNGNGIHLYENTSVLPMTFAAPYTISNTDFISGIDKGFVADIVQNYSNSESYLKTHRNSHYISDVITNKDNDSIYVLIPYDKGWKALVDGKKARVEDAFGYYMMISGVSNGTHRLEIYYIPPYLVVGVIISLISIIAVIILACITKIRRNN